MCRPRCHWIIGKAQWYTSHIVQPGHLRDLWRPIHSSDVGGSHIPSNAKHLHSLLERCIQRNNNFGTAYTCLRRFWYDLATIDFKHELRRREEGDRRRRQNVRGRITTPDIPPRRVWDLYANRVVPYWVGWALPYGISHAWKIRSVSMSGHLSTDMSGLCQSQRTPALI